MNSKPLAVTGLTVVLVSIVLTLAMIVFADGIRCLEWINLETAAWACFVIAFIGAVIGWSSAKQPIGKAAAAIGTLVVFCFLFQLMRSGG